jgi:hypothetical protein
LVVGNAHYFDLPESGEDIAATMGWVGFPALEVFCGREKVRLKPFSINLAVSSRSMRRALDENRQELGLPDRATNKIMRLLEKERNRLGIRTVRGRTNSSIGQGSAPDRGIEFSWSGVEVLDLKIEGKELTRSERNILKKAKWDFGYWRFSPNYGVISWRGRLGVSRDRFIVDGFRDNWPPAGAQIEKPETAFQSDSETAFARVARLAGDCST